MALSVRQDISVTTLSNEILYAHVAMLLLLLSREGRKEAKSIQSENHQNNVSDGPAEK